MSIIYVARSAALTKWASDVGLGKYTFKVGVADDAEGMKVAIAAGWAGESDWKAVASQDAGALTEEEALDRLCRREKPVDPTYYPRLKGAAGVFRVSLTNVQNSLLVAQAMASDEPLSEIKVKPKDIGDYLIRNALS